MNFRKKVFAHIAASMLSVAVACPAMAETWSFDFGARLAGDGPISGTFAQLSVDTDDYLLYNYKLTIAGNLNSMFGSSDTYVSRLYLNSDSNGDPSSVSSLSGGGVAQVRLDSEDADIGGVFWDYAFDFCGTSFDCNTGAANSRLTGGEEIQWTTLFRLNQNPLFDQTESPGFPLLLSVAGYAVDSARVSSYVGSEIVAAPVPEPESYAMLLAGLGLLGFVARRRKKR